MSGEKAREAARRIIDTVPAMMQAVVSEMRHCETPMTMPHFRTLMMLGLHGSFTLTEIAQHQRVSLPTMSATVSVLADRGWVERVTDANDRRRTDVRLTGEGKTAVRAMYGRVEDLLAERLSCLSDGELVELEAGLGVLRQAFGSHQIDPRAEELA